MLGVKPSKFFFTTTKILNLLSGWLKNLSPMVKGKCCIFFKYFVNLTNISFQFYNLLSYFWNV